MSQISNQRGFVLVFMIGLLPFLLSLMFFIKEVGLVQLEYSQKLHTCREKILETQQILGRAITRLMRLNPKAKRLRRERKVVDKVVRSTIGVPVAHEAARIAQAIVIARQIALKLEQTQIQTRAILEANRSLNTLRSEKNSNWDAPKLAIRATPPLDLSPSYETLPNFEHRQSITVRMQTKNAVPLECSATLEKEFNRWRPKLGRGRSLWSSFSY